jgi:hypothetical protein
VGASFMWRGVRRPSLLPVLVLGAAALATLIASDWIAGVAVVLLWAAWHFLQPQVGPPVLPMAFSFQWVQVTGGIFYSALTGRLLPTIYEVDYRPMVLIGLGCLTALLIGLWSGTRLLRGRTSGSTLDAAFSWPTLVQMYVASVVLNGLLRDVAWSIPQLSQPILILSLCRYGLLFLMFRRLSAPRVRWGWIGLILTGEVLLGFTGYFAEFREALVIAALALLEVFDRRQVLHWVGVGAMGVLLFFTGLTWMAIKNEYRAEMSTGVLSDSRLDRLDRVGALTSQWLATDLAAMGADTDRLIERLWAVHFGALAVQRVPTVLPHENGAILGAAVWHVLTPRLFFPNKPVPPSESEMVRKYSGVWVAGPEQGTTIAFGYAAESYVDFGIPWMFLPVFVYGLVMGVAYHWFLRVIRHRELAVALVSVVFWVSLYQYDRSWLKTLGLAGTMLIYLGGTAVLLDRYLSTRRLRRRRPLPRALVVGRRDP